MDLRLLRSFLAAATEKNISRAAQKLHMTQPSLSRQIKALEDDLKIPLLDRGAHSFTLTPAGQVLMKDGPALITHAEQLRQRALGRAMQQQFRIGYSPSLAAGLLAGAMEHFTASYPEVQIELCDLGHQEMVTGLQDRKLDLILTIAPAKETEGVRWHPIAQEEWHVILPDQHPLKKAKVLRAQDLAGQKLVIYNREDYPGYWSRLQTWLKAEKISLSVATECDGITSLFSAVEAGIGIAIVLGRSIQLKPRKIAVRALKSGPAPVHIAAGVLADHEAAAQIQAFLKELQNAGAPNAK